MIHRTVNADFPSLTLPDGRSVAPLRVGELYRVFSAYGVPGITASMGKQDLLARYESALIARAEAVHREANNGRVPPQIADRELRAAIQAMAKESGVNV